jgi:hypothetical protein
MVRRKGTPIVIAALSLLILLLISCGPRSAETFAEKIIEKAAARAGEDIDIDLGDETVSITDGEGNSITIGSSELPEGWPDSIPIKRNMEVLFASASEDGGKNIWTVTASYPGSSTELYDFYKKEFADWEISADMLMESEGTKNYNLQVANDSYQISLLLADEDDTTAVVIGVAQQ